MYLSKVRLLSSSQAQHELIALQKKGAYGAHQLLWKMFSEDDERNFLYREEQVGSGYPEFFLLSRNKPSLLPMVFDIQSKAFNPVLSVGQRLGFKLRVNPTVAKKDDQRKRQRHDVLMNAKRQLKEEGIKDSRRVKHAMEQAALAWFADEKRLDQWGIQLDALPNIESYTQHRSSKQSGKPIQFSSVDFQGVITVKDVQKFLAQYQKGFGRSKAFGCGLMLIRRI